MRRGMSNLVFLIWEFIRVLAILVCHLEQSKLTPVWSGGKLVKYQQLQCERKWVSSPAFLSSVLPGLFTTLFTLLKGYLLPQVGPKSLHAMVIIIRMILWSWLCFSQDNLTMGKIWSHFTEKPMKLLTENIAVDTPFSSKGAWQDLHQCPKKLSLVYSAHTHYPHTLKWVAVLAMLFWL